MRNPMTMQSILLQAMTSKFLKILHLVLRIMLKTIWLENLAWASVEEPLMPWLCKFIRGGEVHRAVSFCQTLVFFPVKEKGIMFNLNKLWDSCLRCFFLSSYLGARCIAPSIQLFGNCSWKIPMLLMV